jgi:hypothetical protein
VLGTEAWLREGSLLNNNKKLSWTTTSVWPDLWFYGLTIIAVTGIFTVSMIVFVTPALVSTIAVLLIFLVASVFVLINVMLSTQESKKC